MRLVSHVSPFTRKASVLVGVSSGCPTSDPVRWQAVHSQEFGSDRLRQMLPLRFVADVAMTSFTQDNCLLNTRGRHRRDLSSTHSANREFFSTYSASQQKVQISHRTNDSQIFHTKAAEASGYKRKTWKENVEAVFSVVWLTQIWLLFARRAYFPWHLGCNRDKYSHFTFELLEMKNIFWKQFSNYPPGNLQHCNTANQCKIIGNKSVIVSQS